MERRSRPVEGLPHRSSYSRRDRPLFQVRVHEGLPRRDGSRPSTRRDDEDCPRGAPTRGGSTLTEALTQEQKTHLIERIRKFRATIQPAHPLDIFKSTLLWSIEATSALEMIRLTNKADCGQCE